MAILKVNMHCLPIWASESLWMVTGGFRWGQDWIIAWVVPDPLTHNPWIWRPLLYKNVIHGNNKDNCFTKHSGHLTCTSVKRPCKATWWIRTFPNSFPRFSWGHLHSTPQASGRLPNINGRHFQEDMSLRSSGVPHHGFGTHNDSILSFIPWKRADSEKTEICISNTHNVWYY